MLQKFAIHVDPETAPASFAWLQPITITNQANITVIDRPAHGIRGRRVRVQVSFGNVVTL